MHYHAFYYVTSLSSSRPSHLNGSLEQNANVLISTTFTTFPSSSLVKFAYFLFAFSLIPLVRDEVVFTALAGKQVTGGSSTVMCGCSSDAGLHLLRWPQNVFSKLPSSSISVAVLSKWWVLTHSVTPNYGTPSAFKCCSQYIVGQHRAGNVYWRLTHLKIVNTSLRPSSIVFQTALCYESRLLFWKLLSWFRNNRWLGLVCFATVRWTHFFKIILYCCSRLKFYADKLGFIKLCLYPISSVYHVIYY